MNNPALSTDVVILDRDGTIVIDRGYLDDPAGLEFAFGAPEGLKWLYDHGYRLVVITNQSGVGRGFFPLERLEAMNAHLSEMVMAVGARLAGIYYCPHAPAAGCLCRKPALGLMERAAVELGFNPQNTVVIGDKESDIEFGRRAGAATIFVSGDNQKPPTKVKPDAVVPNFLEAARAVTLRAPSPSRALPAS